MVNKCSVTITAVIITLMKALINFSYLVFEMSVTLLNHDHASLDYLLISE